MRYGLVTSELSELSPTFRKQSVGELTENGDEYAIAYLQNVGNKNVLLRGLETSALIMLSLNDKSSSIGEELDSLCNAITMDIDEGYKDTCRSYFEKLIENALNTAHGTLIAVVKDNEDNIEACKARHSDGIYLPTPIDICDFVMQSEEQKTREASTSNRLHSSLLQSMLHHDGVTIFTTKGRVLGYHIFVEPDGSEKEEIVGGARTRAFEVLKLSKIFECCFYKSQDGNEKIWGDQNDE